jgi:hypothetical protein
MQSTPTDGRQHPGQATWVLQRLVVEYEEQAVTALDRL